MMVLVEIENGNIIEILPCNIKFIKKMKEFIEKIANIGLYPTNIEFWELIKQAKEILKNE